MAWCCSHQEPEYKYQVKELSRNENGEHQQVVKYYNSLEEVDKVVKDNANASITKVKTQVGFEKLKERMVKNKEKFTDETFPIGKTSLGEIQGNITWKRIPEIIKNHEPVLFSGKIQPKSVIADHEGDCYLLSSLAALAEFPHIIKSAFHNQAYNAEGIYKVSLRIDGVVEEVVVDDYIPVNEHGLPLFCQPNKKNGEFWVLILEKALAKASGSYANLNGTFLLKIEGVPRDIFRAVTHASSDSLPFTDEPHDAQNVWNIIKQNTHNHYPLCATTKDHVVHEMVKPTRTYTLVSAEELHNEHGSERVIKLRNPWNAVDNKENDHHFWDGLAESPKKTSIRQINNGFDYGLFYMTFNDFISNFDQIHYCNLNNGEKFISEPMTLSNKASFFDVTIPKEDVYTFQLNQSKVAKQTEEQRREEEACRSTLLLVKVTKSHEAGVRYEFINGIMKYQEANTILTEQLAPGNYVLYSKIDPTIQGNKFPESAIVNISAKSLAALHQVPRTKYPSLLRDTFLDHAFRHKKQEYNDKKVWISWQLFLQKGGFAYLAFGNHEDSEMQIAVQFNQQQFNDLHFKLKKPLKGCGNNKKLLISPGETDIIIARVKNNPSETLLKFPPKLLQLKLQNRHIQ